MFTVNIDQQQQNKRMINKKQLQYCRAKYSLPITTLNRLNKDGQKKPRNRTVFNFSEPGIFKKPDVNYLHNSAVSSSQLLKLKKKLETYLQKEQQSQDIKTINKKNRIRTQPIQLKEKQKQKQLINTIHNHRSNNNFRESIFNNSKFRNHKKKMLENIRSNLISEGKNRVASQHKDSVVKSQQNQDNNNPLLKMKEVPIHHTRFFFTKKHILKPEQSEENVPQNQSMTIVKKKKFDKVMLNFQKKVYIRDEKQENQQNQYNNLNNAIIFQKKASKARKYGRKEKIEDQFEFGPWIRKKTTDVDLHFYGIN